jgi:hypothetical protein
METNFAQSEHCLWKYKIVNGRLFVYSEKVIISLQITDDDSVIKVARKKACGSAGTAVYLTAPGMSYEEVPDDRD